MWHHVHEHNRISRAAAAAAAARAAAQQEGPVSLDCLGSGEYARRHGRRARSAARVRPCKQLLRRLPEAEDLGLDLPRACTGR